MANCVALRLVVLGLATLNSTKVRRSPYSPQYRKWGMGFVISHVLHLLPIPGNGFGYGVDLEFFVDAFDVGPHRFYADGQLVGHELVTHALG
jgi:hypothetical protein